MTPVEWEVENIDLLKTIAEKRGCTLSQKGFARFWNGNKQNCDETIEVPGSKHDIALNRSGDYWSPSFDSYGADGRRTHAMCGDLYEDYSMEMAQEAAMLDGLSMDVETTGDRVKITLTEM